MFVGLMQDLHPDASTRLKRHLMRVYFKQRFIAFMMGVRQSERRRGDHLSRGAPQNVLPVELAIHILLLTMADEHGKLGEPFVEAYCQ